jgi:hypothetical protein
MALQTLIILFNENCFSWLPAAQNAVETCLMTQSTAHIVASESNRQLEQAKCQLLALYCLWQL